jgi:WD40 repeat protein
MKALINIMLLAFCFQGFLFAQKPELHITQGHLSNVNRAVFSDDGKFLITGGESAEVIIWDVKTGREIRTLRSHTRSITSLAWSNDNNYILSACDQKVVLWNARTGEILKEISSDWMGNSVLFVKDNLYRLTFDSVLVYDLQTMEVIQKIDIQTNREETSYPRFFRVNENDKLLVAYQWDIPFRVFDLKTQKEISLTEPEMKDSFGNLESDLLYVTSPDGSFNIEVQEFNNSKILDAESKTEIGSLPEANTFVFSKVVNKTSNGIRQYLLVSMPPVYARIDHEVTNYFELWQLTNTGDTIYTQKLKTLKGATDQVSAAKINGLTKELIIAGNVSLSSLDLKRLNFKSNFKDNFTLISGMVFSPDRKTIYTSSSNWKAQTAHLIQVWDAESHALIRTLEAPASTECYQLQISRDGNFLISNDWNGVAYLWNLKKSVIIGKVPSYHASTFDFSNDNKYFLLENNHELLLVSTGKGKLNHTLLLGEDFSVSEIKTKPNSNLAYASAEYQYFTDTVLFYNFDTKQIVGGLPGVGRNLCFDSSGTRFYSIQKNQVNYYSEDKLVNSILVYGAVDLSMTDDGKYLVVLAGHAVHLLDLKTFTITASVSVFVSDQGVEHLIYTPDGYYSGSKNSIKAASFIIEMSVYPFDQFDMERNRPDTILQKIGYARADMIDLYKRAYHKRLRNAGLSEAHVTNFAEMPPSVVLKTTRETYLAAADRHFAFTLEAVEPKYFLSTYNVHVNGVPVFGLHGVRLEDAKTKKINTPVNIFLSSGRNLIEAVATNSNGRESFREAVEINCTDQASVKFWYIGIGVSDYIDAGMNLKYAAKDIMDFAAMVEESKKEKAVVTLFLNHDATRDQVLAVKKKLTESGPDDIVILSLSGHGLLDEELDFYFATHDMDFSHPALRGLPFHLVEDLLDSIPARKKVLLIDACHSGAVDVETAPKKVMANNTAMSDTVKSYGFKGAFIEEVDSLRPAIENVFVLMQELFSEVNKGSGTLVISAAAGNSYALESPKWNNGVFTYAILNGLKNGKADFNSDGEILVSELRKYVVEEVVLQTNGKQQPTSRQVNADNDFMIWGE